MRGDAVRIGPRSWSARPGMRIRVKPEWIVGSVMETGMRDDSMNIRPARPDEAAAITALTVRSKASWGYDAAFMAMVEEDLATTAAQITDDTVAVIEAGGQLAGFVHLRPEDDLTCELVSLFVDAWALGRGHGGRLWDHAVATARAAGYRTMTFTSDPHAEGFYRRQGALEVGREASTIVPGRTLALMRFDLGAE